MPPGRLTCVCPSAFDITPIITMDEQMMSQPQSQQQKQEANMSVFQSLQGSLEQEATLRETIRDSVREFDTNVRSLTAQCALLLLLLRVFRSER